MPTLNSGPMLAFLPADTLINRAAIRCGLKSSANPVGDTNPDMVLLLELLNKVGEDLTSQVTTYTHVETIGVGDGITSSIALPNDFDGLLDGAVWLPDGTHLTGPMSNEQYWEGWRKYSIGTFSPSPSWFRLGGGTIDLFPVFGVTDRIYYRYQSINWCRIEADQFPTQSGVVIGTDVPCYDSRLLIAALVYEFKTAKGQDNSVALADYAARLRTAKEASRSAPALDMAGGGLTGERFISNANSGDQILG
jgi:hypothetical protein